MKKKIIIGSANFNQNYGINNNNISKKEIKKLINLAKKQGINTIDTAAAYKDSEKIIGSLKFKKLKIISKIPKIPFDLEKNKRIRENPYLLYVGNVKPHKNLRKLLDAFNIIKGKIKHDLVIVGKIEGFITPDNELIEEEPNLLLSVAILRIVFSSLDR